MHTQGELGLEDIELLTAIGATGSMAAAARELGKVPSALTYQVRRLEERLDLLLVDRRSGRAQLTEAAQLLVREGRDVRLQIRQPDTRISHGFVVPGEKQLLRDDRQVRELLVLESAVQLRVEGRRAHGESS